MFKWLTGRKKENNNELETTNRQLALKYMALETILMALLKENDFCLNISKESFEYIRDNGPNLEIDYNQTENQETLVSLSILGK